MGTDLSTLRRELQDRRQQLRELNGRARAIQLQIFNYQTIDETRRALSEHLMAERNLQEGHRQERVAEANHRISELKGEIEHLEKEARAAPVPAPAESAARAHAESALEAERNRRALACQQEEAESADHERAVRDGHTALENVEAADRSHQRIAARNDDSDDTLAEVRGRAELLVQQIGALRGELDTEVGREQQEVHRILAQLEIEQAGLEECQTASAEMERALARLEAATPAPQLPSPPPSHAIGPPPLPERKSAGAPPAQPSGKDG